MASQLFETVLKEGIWASPESTVVFGIFLIGLTLILRSIFTFVAAFWNSYLRPGLRLKKYGKWAIVTGATDGIGKAFSKHLAKQKINLVLISRSEDKLAAYATELETKYKVSVKTLAIDLTTPDLATALKPVEEVVAAHDVGILINNAGMSYPFAQYLHEVDDELIANLLKINIEALTRLTKIVLPPMLARRKGAIVNIGSGAATVLPSDPLYAVYAGTKGYVDQFSKTLAVEYQALGIDVQCQAPLYVATKLAKIRFASFTCPSADTYAKCGVRWIGQAASVTTPYPVHTLMWWVIATVPERLMNAIRLSQNLSVRRRAIAKLLKKKDQ